MNKKLKEIANIKFCLSLKDINEQVAKIITPPNLLENNIINEIVCDNKLKVDKSLKVKQDNIIIKRINPYYINYINYIEDDVYAGGNLILINDISINPKYLACILNKTIKSVTKSLTGATIPAVSRGDLEDIPIPIPPLEKQIAIGELWYKSIELNKLKIKLNVLENLKQEYTINQIIYKFSGGKENGQ